MNVLMVSPQFRPLVGGYERAAEQLSIGLASRGHKVMVLAERRFPSWPRLERDEGVEIRRWRCWYRPKLHIATSLIGLLWNLLRFGRRFDVWHIHQYGSHAALAIALGRLLRRPTVLKLTSSSYGGISEALRTGRLARVMTSLHRQASAIAAPSRETAKEAVSFGICQRRVRVIGNGVDLLSFSLPTDDEVRRTRRKLGLDAVRVAISIGRLAPEKQLDCLLAAWAHAHPRLGEPWVLVVAGDGPELTRLQATVASLGLKDGVRFVGHTEQVRDWLCAADIFVQSSSNEGLSNTMLEALATGLPVVCTDVSGTEECVREPDTGLVVPIGDAARLADAIVELANDDARRAQMSQRAVALVQEWYSIDHVCALCEVLYRSLIAQGRRH